MTMSDVSHTQKPENVDTREQKTTDREPSVAKSASTAVDHPAHYNHDGTLEGARRKAAEDAEKAIWYLRECIKDVQSGDMDAYLEV